MPPDWLKTTMAQIVLSLQLAKTEFLTPYTYFFWSLSENFSAYSILRVALFSAASPVEGLRSAGWLIECQSSVDRRSIKGIDQHSTVDVFSTHHILTWWICHSLSCVIIELALHAFLKIWLCVASTGYAREDISQITNSPAFFPPHSSLHSLFVKYLSNKPWTT